MYPLSAMNLNPGTNQIDVDVYDQNDNKVDVSGMTNVTIQILIGRNKARAGTNAISVPGLTHTFCYVLSR